MVAIVVAIVVFMVPMAVVHLPAAIIPIVVGVRPVSTGVGRSLPDAGTPGVASTFVTPVAVGPDVAFAGHGRASFHAGARWGTSDVDVNLGDGGGGEGGGGEGTCCED